MKFLQVDLPGSLAFIIILLLAACVEPNPGPVIAQGNFHQGDPFHFPRTAGKQCVPNSFAACAFGKKVGVATIDEFDDMTLLEKYVG